MTEEHYVTRTLHGVLFRLRLIDSSIAFKHENRWYEFMWASVMKPGNICFYSTYYINQRRIGGTTKIARKYLKNLFYDDFSLFWYYKLKTKT